MENTFMFLPKKLTKDEQKKLVLILGVGSGSFQSLSSVQIGDLFYNLSIHNEFDVLGNPTSYIEIRIKNQATKENIMNIKVSPTFFELEIVPMLKSMCIEEEEPTPVDTVFSVATAAEELKISTRKVRNLLKSGKLKGFKEAGVWNVLESSVIEYSK